MYSEVSTHLAGEKVEQVKDREADADADERGVQDNEEVRERGDAKKKYWVFQRKQNTRKLGEKFRVTSVRLGKTLKKIV